MRCSRRIGRGWSYIGRSRYDAPEIDNSVIFSSDTICMPGDIVNVMITDALTMIWLEEWRNKMNLPNKLTMLRILMIPVFIIVLMTGHSYISP
jgi:hypothetical protein